MSLRNVNLYVQKWIFSSLIFLSPVCYGNSVETFQQVTALEIEEGEVERSLVGERISSAVEEAEFEKERSEKLAELEKTEHVLIKKPLFNTSHSGIYQNLFGNNNYQIELQDRSIWSIHPSEVTMMYYWRTSDYIVISPSGLRSYPYFLTNQRTGEALRASLYLGPDANRWDTFRVVNISFDRQYLTLSDGSQWDMSKSDFWLLMNWKVGDIVILGLNTGDGSYFYPNILINVQTNNFSFGCCVAQ